MALGINAAGAGHNEFLGSVKKAAKREPAQQPPLNLSRVPKRVDNRANSPLGAGMCTGADGQKNPRDQKRAEKSIHGNVIVEGFESVDLSARANGRRSRATAWCPGTTMFEPSETAGSATG
jgi:hypothetical protein